MPSKFQTTVEMVAHTAKDITAHPETFMSFLFHDKQAKPPTPKLRFEVGSLHNP